MGATPDVGAPSGAPFILPGTIFAPTAGFVRRADDLLLSNDSGETVLLLNYFACDTGLPDLVSANGTVVRGGTAAILAGAAGFVQVAQAGGVTAGPVPIGKVRV